MDNPRPEKVAVVTEVREHFERANAAILTEYRGLTVKDLATLRRTLRDAGSEYKIYKNTLVRFAAVDLGLSELESLLVGPTAIAFVDGDASNVAKALRDYARTNPKLTVKGGVLGNKIMSVADATALADLPPREVVLARLAGALAAPMRTFAGLLEALPRSFAYGLKALIDKRRDEDAAAAASSADGPAAAAPVVTGPGASAPGDAATSTSPDSPAPSPAADTRAEAEPESAASEPAAGAPATTSKPAEPAVFALAPEAATKVSAPPEPAESAVPAPAEPSMSAEPSLAVPAPAEPAESAVPAPAEPAVVASVADAVSAAPLDEAAPGDAEPASALMADDEPADGGLAAGAGRTEAEPAEVEPLAAHGIPTEVEPEIISVEPEPDAGSDPSTPTTTAEADVPGRDAPPAE